VTCSPRSRPSSLRVRRESGAFVIERSPPSGRAITGPESTREKQALWQSELVVSDVIGRLIEFWGFKRNMGRVWSVLYLSPHPLSAEDLRELLQLSSGAVSMTLSELSRWGVVRKVWIQGERKDFFAAEVQLWRMISRVFNEREKIEIIGAIDAFQESLQDLERLRRDPDPKVRTRAELQFERITHLLDLAKLGKGLIDALLATAKLDAEPLVKLLLGARPSSSSAQR
jgi:DNA-binding transcriptional regulator GbsR (MarR family)